MSNKNLSLTAAFSAPVIRIVGEQEVTFPRFTMPDLAGLGAMVKARWIDSAKKGIDASGLQGLDKYRALRAAEDTEPALEDLWVYAGGPIGANDVLIRSLTKGGMGEGDAKKVVEQLHPREAIETAMLLVGYEIQPPQGADDGKKKAEPTEGYTR